MRNKSLVYITCETYTLCGISSCFRLLSPTHRQVIHALLTRPPLTQRPKAFCPFDLNVLCTPPAFILSQDQTLECWYLQSSFSNSINQYPSFNLALYFLRVNSFPILKKELSRFRRTVLLFSFFRTIDCCSIFKDHRLFRTGFSASRLTAYLLYHILSFLSTPFFNFFTFLFREFEFY